MVERILVGRQGETRVVLSRRNYVSLLPSAPISEPKADDVTRNSRPGILILINSTDWELEGELEYELEEGDGIVFISTLHGG